MARCLRFGPLGVRLSGPLCDVPWPLGARALEGEERADDLLVTTRAAGNLRSEGPVLADGTVWVASKRGEGVLLGVRRGLGEQLCMQLELGSTPARLSYDPELLTDTWFHTLMQLAVACWLPAAGGVLLHAACVRMGAESWLLCGTSGVGKSTLARRLVRAGAELMSHDRTMVFASGAPIAVSTPWGGDNTLPAARREAPVGRVFFLEQGTTSLTRALTPAGALKRIASVLLGPAWQPSLLGAALHNAGSIAAAVPCFEAVLNDDDNAVRCVLDAQASEVSS